MLTKARHHRVRVAPGYGSEEKARIPATCATSTSSAARGQARSRRVVVARSRHPPQPRRTLLLLRQHRDDVRCSSGTPRAGLPAADPRRPWHVTPSWCAHDLGRRKSATRAAMTFVDEFEDYRSCRKRLNDPAFHDDLIALGLNPETGARHGAVAGAGRRPPRRHDAATCSTPAPAICCRLHVEQAGQWMPAATTTTPSTRPKPRSYQPFGRIVLAGRARIGTIDAPGVLAANVPFFKRYFLGGSTQPARVGPLRDLAAARRATPSAGIACSRRPQRSAFRCEAVRRRGLRRCRQGARDAGTTTHFDLRTDVGIGVRYLTPIGPVRVDFGYQLTRWRA